MLKTPPPPQEIQEQSAATTFCLLTSAWAPCSLHAAVYPEVEISLKTAMQCAESVPLIEREPALSTEVWALGSWVTQRSSPSQHLQVRRQNVCQEPCELLVGIALTILGAGLGIAGLCMLTFWGVQEDRTTSVPSRVHPEVWCLRTS